MRVSEKSIREGNRFNMVSPEVYETIACPATWWCKRNTEASIIALSDGQLLLAYSQFYGPPYRWDVDDDFWVSRISGKISKDLGRTWSSDFTIQENDAEVNTMSPSLMRLRSGEIAVFYMKNRSFVGNDGIRMYMRKSFDEGVSWETEDCVTSTPGMAAANDRALQLSSGRIVLPVSLVIEGRPDPTGVTWPTRIQATCIYSDDNGETWYKAEGEVDAPKRGAMEPAVVELKDGRLLMVMRTQMGRVYQAYSDDQGGHWTKSEPMSLVAPESCPHVKRIPTTGDLLIVFNHGFQPEADHCGRRNPLSSAISKDEGGTWENIKNVEELPYGCWEDRKGNRREWSWSLSMPSITFVENKTVLSYWMGLHSPGALRIGCDYAIKVKVLDTEWFYTE